MNDFKIHSREIENLRQQGVFDPDSHPQELVEVQVGVDRTGSRVIKFKFQYVAETPYNDAPQLARLIDEGSITVEQANKALQLLREGGEI
jgi:hypothetical protein